MKSKLVLEKNAESMLSLSNSLAVAGVLAPFSYLIELSNLDVTSQWILRTAPLVIIVGSIILRKLAFDIYEKIGT